MSTVIDFTDETPLMEWKNTITTDETISLIPFEKYVLPRPMRTPFWKSFVRVYQEELEGLLNDVLRSKSKMYDVSTVTEDTVENLDNIAKFLDYELARELMEYLFIGDTGTQDADMLLEWRKFDIFSIALRRKYIASRQGFEMIFGSIWRHGGVYLLAGYERVTLPTKLFRLVDKEKASAFFPDREDGFPQVGFAEGYTSSNSYKGKYIQLDTGRTLDEANFILDRQEHPVLKKAVALDLTLDRVLYHKNTFDGIECLCDLPWLNYIATQARLNQKVTEKVYVGCQMSLMTDNSGFYVYGDREHSVPDIKANFQVIKHNWDENNSVEEIVVGTGTKDDIWLTTGDANPKGIFGTALMGDSVFHERTTVVDDLVPIDLNPFVAKPLFGSTISDFEVRSNDAYLEINTMVKSYVIEDWNPLIPQHSKMVISLPYRYVAKGTLSVELEFLEDDGVTVSRNIISEVYNPLLRKWEFKAPFDAFNRILLENCSLDRDTGILILEFTDIPVSKPSITYTTNSTRDYYNIRDIDSATVAITEMGIYNKLGKMIAYANFPPVIYRSDQNHLSFNLYVKKGAF